MVINLHGICTVCQPNSKVLRGPGMKQNVHYPMVHYQELMSAEGAKERATTAYARVPSKSKSLASQLPNMETNRSIKRHDDDTETPRVP